MKFFILFLLINLSHSSLRANALPILNLNGATVANNIVIYLDSKDINLFYVVPNLISTSKQNGGGAPDFLYYEYRANWSHRAVVQSVLHPAIKSDELALVQKKLLERDPNAVFASLPYQSSRIELSGELTPLVESSDCSHEAGKLA